MVYWYKGILDNKKESTTQINYNMEKIWKTLWWMKEARHRVQIIWSQLYEAQGQTILMCDDRKYRNGC